MHIPTPELVLLWDVVGLEGWPGLPATVLYIYTHATILVLLTQRNAPQLWPQIMPGLHRKSDFLPRDRCAYFSIKSYRRVTPRLHYSRWAIYNLGIENTIFTYMITLITET